MAESFPVSLQDKFNEAGFSFELGDTAMRTSMNVGEDKVRQRYTRAIDKLGGTIELELDDYTDLQTFYRTTLAGGTKTFFFDDPFTQVQSEYRFLRPPQIRPIGGRYFRISFNWEQIA